jgi:DNA repair protein SbcD/Mre11
MRILLTADLHMGRRPSRLPEHIDTGPLSTTACWAAIVESAIEERVDLVALGGDVVDQANRFYEAVGPFEEGVKRLAAAGIRVVAVAGNHDHETLAAVAGNLDLAEFTLLGRGGRWERVTIERDGAPALHVDGWSFPQSWCEEDPLRDYRPGPADGVPVLGLLHADLEAGASRYAPVRLADLRMHPTALWLLGHVHASAVHEVPGAATVLYPGSPQAMDPGESGVHGVWLAELEGASRFTLRQIPLSTVRYETLEVDVAGESTEGGLDARVSGAVRDFLRGTVERGCGPLRYLSLRVRLTGRTPLHRVLAERLDRIAGELQMEHGGVTALVERATLATRPALDLPEIARGRDAPGIVARLALAIDADRLTADQEALLQRAVRAADEVRGARAYRSVVESDADAPSRAEALEVLRERSLLLLDTLMAQKEVA